MNKRVYHNKIFPVILCIMFIFILTSQCFARQGDVIKGDVQLVEGSKYGIGTGFSFVFDRKNVPCVSYYDSNRKILKYAYVHKGRWIVETVTGCGFSEKGLVSCLAFDSGNNPYIAFYGADETLKLAVKKGKEWVTETVDGDRGSGLYCSLVITPGGDPVLSYQGREGTMFARKLAGSWAKEKIGEPGRKTEVFINSDSKIQIYYMGSDEKGAGGESSDGNVVLKNASKADAGWKTSNISDSKGLTDFNVAFDSKGSPTITYIRDKKIRIYRETLPGSSVWKEDQVGSEDCYRLSVGIKKNGLPSITYIADKQEELKFAAFDGTKWKVSTVASAKKGYSFVECQIVSDKSDRDLIVLYDSDSLHLFLRRGEGWGLGRIDGKNKTGGFINLLTGRDGKPMICFYDYTKTELHFAQEENSKWPPVVVDSTGDVGQYASMALDQEKNPHISYYDSTRGDLKYAWKAGEYWKWERVDHGKDTGVDISMSVTKDNVPGIAYRCVTTGYLKFAYKKDNKWDRERVVKLGKYGGKCVLLDSPTGETRIIYIDGFVNEKASGKESPVKNFIRMATRVGKDKWDIQELIGSEAVSISQPGLSGDISSNGDIAVCYADREGKLSIIRTENGNWSMERFDDTCWENTSVKFNRDGSLGILFLSGKTRKDAILKYVTYFNGDWKSYRVDFPTNNIRFLSLADGPDGILRFACQDFYNSMVFYFQENK